MMPAAAIPQANAGPGQHALVYAGMGWRVLPIKPGEKRPPMSAWQHAASTDPKVIVNWFKGLYQNHGCGIATGEESGLWVLDVDVGEGKAGVESLAELEQRHGPLPPTVEAVTGSGGRHLYFSWPAGRRVVTRRDTGATDSPLPAGIDVRGEGGQVLAPPTVHPNGSIYRWREGCAPWDREPADAPDWLLAIVVEREAPTAPVSAPAGAEGFLAARSEDDSIAEWLDRTEHWDTLLLRDGWTPMPAHGDQQYWVRPGKQVRDGHSAVLHLPDGPFVIFSTDGSLGKYALPEARVASGDGWAYSKFGYLAASRHGGDRSATARRLREIRTEREGYALAVEVGEETPGPSERSRFVRTGAEFILDQTTALVPLWGTDDQMLWTRGEPLLLVAPTGVGKTTLAIQLVAARLGLASHVLGLPVEDDGDRILYLAMDRPPQIARAMARVFTEADRSVLSERLVVWRGPPPSDLGKRPETLLELCQENGCKTVFIDSLKDAAVKISDDEVGGNLNRAIQMCTVNDIQVAGLHHQRKRQSGGEKPKSLDDIYGSVWIPAGAGSVVLLWGAAGDPIVELVHLKQPANEVGPWKLEHDHHHGTTTIFHGFDPLAYLRNRGSYGATASEAAKAMTDKQAVTDNERKKAQRLLDGLVRKGLATRTEPNLGGAGGSEGARYRAVEDPFRAPDTAPAGGCSGGVNGGAPDTPDTLDKVPAQSTGHVTGQVSTARAPDTAPLSIPGGGVRDAPHPDQEEDDWEPPF